MKVMESEIYNVWNIPFLWWETLLHYPETFTFFLAPYQ